jgi:hypothetical protein
MGRIEATYLAQVDDLIFDLQVGSTPDGGRMLVIANLVEVFANADGVLDSFRPCVPDESLVGPEELGSLDETALESLARRRLQLAGIVVRLFGSRLDQAVTMLAGS